MHGAHPPPPAGTTPTPTPTLLPPNLDTATFTPAPTTTDFRQNISDSNVAAYGKFNRDMTIHIEMAVAVTELFPHQKDWTESVVHLVVVGAFSRHMLNLPVRLALRYAASKFLPLVEDCDASQELKECCHRASVIVESIDLILSNDDITRLANSNPNCHHSGQRALSRDRWHGGHRQHHLY